MKTVSATIFSDDAFCFQLSNQNSNKNVRVKCCADDELRNIRCQKARDHYANMPLDKKAELNARKRENYHRRKAEKQSGGSFKLSCLFKLTCLFNFKCLFNNRVKNNL